MATKILIVDDHQEFRTAVREYLNNEKIGLEVFEASTSEMAVTKASGLKPEIVIMDINLPNGNGLDAAKHIKEDCPDCDVIILTMFDIKPFKQIAHKIKIKYFVGKNEILEKLVPVIKKCMKCKEKKEKTDE